MSKADARLARTRRHARVRNKVCGTTERPRLCVFRSIKNIYAQVIDDSAGHTVACASNLEKDVQGKIEGKSKVETAGIVGTLVAQRATGNGIKKVVFDRGGYQYHGRVKALAEAARKEGLEF
jgi:large subunit ribosomal protein L18